MYVDIYQTFLYEKDVTRSILKKNLTGLNWEFSFSQIGCLTKSKELSLLYLPIAREKNRWIYAFAKGIPAKWYANSLNQDLNLDYHHGKWTWQSLHQECLHVMYIFTQSLHHKQEVTNINF